MKNNHNKTPMYGEKGAPAKGTGEQKHGHGSHGEQGKKHQHPGSCNGTCHPESGSKGKKAIETEDEDYE
jgi:hypothetical protein